MSIVDDGVLVTADEPRRGSLVLTHGAGSNCNAPLLVGVADQFRIAGFDVLRFDLPFRRVRKSGPPHPSQAAADRDGIKSAITEMRLRRDAPVFVGGHSYGGRQASMLLAEQPEVASGLLLLSYPLHPPNRPAQLRTGHFSQLQTPALFVHGATDPFGNEEEMRSALSLLSGPHTLVIVQGAGHDLKRGKFPVREKAVEPFLQLVESVPH